jgi:DNA-damage-inducible protein J
MAKTETIRARVDAKLKAQAEGVLEKLGLNASEAIRLFYRQVALQKGLPFEVKIPNAATRKAIRDARAGKDVNHYASPDEMYETLGV